MTLEPDTLVAIVGVAKNNSLGMIVRHDGNMYEVVMYGVSGSHKVTASRIVALPSDTIDSGVGCALYEQAGKIREKAAISAFNNRSKFKRPRLPYQFVRYNGELAILVDGSKDAMWVRFLDGRELAILPTAAPTAPPNVLAHVAASSLSTKERHRLVRPDILEGTPSPLGVYCSSHSNGLRLVVGHLPYHKLSFKMGADGRFLLTPDDDYESVEKKNVPQAIVDMLQRVYAQQFGDEPACECECAKELDAIREKLARIEAAHAKK